MSLTATLSVHANPCASVQSCWVQTSLDRSWWTDLVQINCTISGPYGSHGSRGSHGRNATALECLCHSVHLRELDLGESDRSFD
jgi:hypothetical protein